MIHLYEINNPDIQTKDIKIQARDEKFMGDRPAEHKDGIITGTIEIEEPMHKEIHQRDDLSISVQWNK